MLLLFAGYSMPIMTPNKGDRMFKRKPFFLDTTTEFGTVYYRRWNLRHQLIEWMLLRDPVPAEMPETLWIVKLKWHRSLIPGLRFDEA